MKKNKGFAPVLIALIVAGALIIGGGAYWLGKNKGENKKVVENPKVDNQVEEKNNNETENNLGKIEESSISENINTPLFIKSVYEKKGRWWADVDYVTKVTPLEHMTRKINDGSCVIPKMTKEEMLTYAKNTVKKYVEQDNLLVVNCGYDFERIYATIGVHPYFINSNPLIRSFPFAVNFNGLEKANEICGGNYMLYTPDKIKVDVDRAGGEYLYNKFNTEGYFKELVVIENSEIKKFDDYVSCLP